MQSPLTAVPISRRGILAASGAGAVLTATGCAATGGSVDPADNRTLSLAVLRQPTSFDPVAISEGSDSFIWSSIFDTLLFTNQDGEIVPNAAESFEYAEDGLALTLTLRDDLAFSSGTPVTSEAVKFSIDRVRETPGTGQAQTALITAVEAPDDRTVVIQLSQPDPTLLHLLTLRAGIISDPATIEEESSQLDPVGSGPYKLNTEKTTAGATYVLERRDDHWNVDAYPFEEVTIKVIADTTANVNALRSGEIDVAGITPSEAPTFEESGYTLTELDTVAIFQLLIADRDGTIQPALADERVRQAINLAIDRDGLLEAGSQGIGQATAQFYFPFASGYNDDLNLKYPTDPERAKNLMAEAGYADGFNVTMPSLIYTTAHEPLITQMLADIGIEVEWEPIPPQDTVSAITSGTYPIILWVDGVSPSPQVTAMHYTPNGFLNPFHTEDPELTELVEEALVTLDPDRQKELYEQINTFAVEHAWDAPLFYNGQLFALAPGYAYVGAPPMNNSNLRIYDVA